MKSDHIIEIMDADRYKNEANNCMFLGKSVGYMTHEELLIYLGWIISYYELEELKYVKQAKNKDGLVQLQLFST